MKNTSFKTLIALTACVLLAVFAGVLTGCSSMPKDDSGLRALGYMRVTFDCNGGSIEGYRERHIYGLPGAPLPVPSDTGNLKMPVKDVSVEVEGWYLGSKDEDGNITFGRKWDFAADKIGDEDMTLYAKWVDRLRFTVVCGTKESGDIYTETIRYISGFDTSDTARQLNRPSAAPDWSGHTFLEYYTDDSYVTPVTWPVTHTGGEIEQQIYARYVPGEYTVVWTKDDLKSMGTYSRLYLMKDIDMTGVSWAMRNFSGTIAGDDREEGPIRINGISLTVEQAGGHYQTISFGLFGKVTDATFKNVWFEACSLTFTTERSIPTDVGLLAGTVTGATTFTNVKVTGVVTIAAPQNAPLTYNGFYGSIDSGISLAGMQATVTP